MGILMMPAPAVAQATAGADSAASAAYDRIALLEGSWSLEPGAYFLSGGKPPAVHEETCAWLAGGRHHMVCRTRRQQTAGGPESESISVLSYRAADSTYIAHFAFSGGATLTYHGRVDGDRWIMNLQPTPMWPAGEQLRTIITAVDGGLRFVEEHSVAGGPWTVTEDYRYRRLR